LVVDTGGLSGATRTSYTVKRSATFTTRSDIAKNSAIGERHKIEVINAAAEAITTETATILKASGHSAETTGRRIIANCAVG
jgi:hypothetical protein